MSCRARHPEIMKSGRAAAMMFHSGACWRQRPVMTWCFKPACQYGPDGCHEPEIVASRKREHAWQTVNSPYAVCRRQPVACMQFLLGWLS